MKNDLDIEFKPWQRVYTVQCFTWALAIRFNLAKSNFRCLPAFRTEESLLDRKVISNYIKLHRKLLYLKKLIISQIAIDGAHNPITGYLIDVESSINLQEQLHIIQDMESFFL